jgi:lipopolysaccharide transport system permease protein
VTLVPLEWRWLIWLNPMAPLVEQFKSAVFGWPAPPLWAMLLSLLTIATTFAIAFWHFHAMEAHTADKV